MTNEIKKDKKTKTINIVLVFMSILLMILAGLYIYFEKVKSPFVKDYKIDNTDIKIETSYNNKYKIIRINVTLDEVIEDWQINSLDAKTTTILLICETNDKTIKKEYELNDVPLVKGEKIKGNLVIENASFNDYSMLKELIKGDVKIGISDYLTLDTKKRDKLQQEYYNKQKSAKIDTNRPIKNSMNAQNNANSSFLNGLFDF